MMRGGGGDVREVNSKSHAGTQRCSRVHSRIFNIPLAYISTRHTILGPGKEEMGERGEKHNIFPLGSVVKLYLPIKIYI